MKKALLVGNGFTSSLIDSYKNTPMMKEFHQRLPDVIERAEKNFSILRNLDFTINDLYNITEAIFCGNNLICGNDVYPSSDGIYIHENQKIGLLINLSYLVS